MKPIPYSNKIPSNLFREIKSHIGNFDTTIEIDLTDTHNDVNGYQVNFVDDMGT